MRATDDDLSALEQEIGKPVSWERLREIVQALIARTRTAEAERDDAQTFIRAVAKAIHYEGDSVMDGVHALQREVERLREARDEIALLATLGCNTGPTALEACRRIVTLTAALTTPASGPARREP